jgi:flagellar basal-body rod protein FlgG
MTNPALRTSATGMTAQQARVEVIANNLANVNTNGFKRSRAHFEDLLYQTVQGSELLGGADAGVGETIQLGRGTRLSAVQRIDAQGALEQTGRPLDLAIEGDGYFIVELPDGTPAYTRDGSFTVSDQGVIVTTSGYTVQPGITVPPDAVELVISRTGVVSVTTAAGAEPVEIDRIEIARFTNSPGLRALGENLFAETPASGAANVGFPQEDGLGRLTQGYLEASNVEIVQEMVDMIAALRAYEVNSKAVQAGEEMSEMTNNLMR